MAVQGMNIEIQPPEGKIYYLHQLITYQNAVQVEFEHRIKCAWATFTSHRQELTSPKYPLRDRLKLWNDTVTPSLFCASGTWTMTEETKKNTIQVNVQLRMPRGSTIPPTSNPTTPTTNREGDTTEHNSQDLNEHEETSHDAGSNPCFDEIPEDKPEDELQPWVDYITRAVRKADDLLAASGNTPWILRQSRIFWRRARMIPKHHEDRWTSLVSNWNPAVSTKQQGRLTKRWEDDINIYLQPDSEPTETTTTSRAT